MVRLARQAGQPRADRRGGVDSVERGDQMGREHSEVEFMLAGLTTKQREVLDLLIEHKTSKQIARQLGISPHTVDQRIFFAKEKLGAGSRSEVAVAYRRLLGVSGRVTYQETRIAHQARPAQMTAGSLAGQVLGL